MRGDNGNFDGENIGKLESKNAFTIARTGFEMEREEEQSRS
jgi:hypothetical protein